MSQKMRSRRGVTLAELVVVLALLAIMGAMVATFTMLITTRTRASTANDAMRRDCELVEVIAARWMDTLSAADASFEAGGGIAVAALPTEPVKSYKLYCENGFLYGELPAGEDIEIHTETVTSVTFEVMETVKHEIKDYLLFCKVICRNPVSGDEVEFTYCVNSREGERRGATVETAQTSAP